MVLPGFWNAPQACLWFKTRDEGPVASLKPNHTFAELAWETYLDWETKLARDGIDDPEAVLSQPGWIVNAQEKLLAACVTGAIKLLGLPSSGGVSEEIPGAACATARFFCEHPNRGECLGPPGTPPGRYWTDIQVAAEDVRRVWPADGSAAAASSVSIPAVDQPSPADGEQPGNIEQQTEQKRARRTTGPKKRFQRAAAEEYLKRIYPDGVPAEVSVLDIENALKAEGKAVSPRTIRRAMGRK